MIVVKRSGAHQPFDRAKLVGGLEAAAKNRPVSPAQLADVARSVEEELRETYTEVTSEVVGRAVLERLRDLDEVAYVRFASVYKGFEAVDDFRREVGLLTKMTAPKRSAGAGPARA